MEHSDNFIEDATPADILDIHEVDITRNFRRTINGTIISIADDSLNEYLLFERLFRIRVDGFDVILSKMINENFLSGQIILISNAEIISHGQLADFYSMKTRFNMHIERSLINAADTFRRQYLSSYDDVTNSLNEPYLCIHLRRGDFVTTRSNRIPDLDCAIQQIRFGATNVLDVRNIYIATDAIDAEYEYVKRKLEGQGKHNVYNYMRDADKNVLSNWSPGQIAMIDQWICVNSELFIGSMDSTFTFRIQEERQKYHYPPSKTFNALCPRCDQRIMLKLCRQNELWNINIYNVKMGIDEL